MTKKKRSEEKLAKRREGDEEFLPIVLSLSLPPLLLLLIHSLTHLLSRQT